MDVEDLLDWDGLNIKLSRPTTRDGQTSKLEMLILIGLAVNLKPGQNFLEIGTFDGNNTLNISININDSSKVITIDLPEDYDNSAVLSYDDYLVHNSNRSKKKYFGQQNVQQIYEDSTKLDFSKLDFHMSFIDGGHDYNTVKSDSINVMKHIKRPGIILWHDYDVENPVGDFLRKYAKQYDIYHIKDTRMCMTKCY
jgi:predicted O-methyltransferase YrrM